MKLNELTESPLDAILKTNPALKVLKGREYIWKDIGSATGKAQYPPPSRNTNFGHYDAYIEGKPRYKKYFGGSFAKAI